MNWLESLLWDSSSVAHIVCLYAFVISVGVLLGKIKIFGVSLGVTFVLFAGILIVEWPEKGEGYLPAGALRITAAETATGREWQLEGDEAWADRLSEKDFA